MIEDESGEVHKCMCECECAGMHRLGSGQLVTGGLEIFEQ